MQWALDHASDPGVDAPIVQGSTGGPAGPQAQRGSFSTFSTHSAGIAGILARQEQQAAKTDQYAPTACERIGSLVLVKYGGCKCHTACVTRLPVRHHWDIFAL